ncbi:MAG: N(G),N(G)-dimethylarginine dimethylaminohydrolase [Candidatus Aminicenantes bacterium]|nr:N(G),N(G)-dimethylarginine dimethylaminohydrolase [Candidatus Aminicenantes bacterium]NIM85113.1 N(G),N(G)-dimethylarginine dimethylaminohydrolase [Candidatus Aminicenantes bacterium]NIN24623.1 N(G),N(G)-dimethylarginine dimethylaminohydrolase [Candidatus Aminicenantes bacterium]NIN48384.1 N(G),N(G)-dimethylarginine dimethylaminohydrolase [Candidatus Aminicenantes bacterium]NIN91287.1 N(G),N(G)-dimethylarginine dimethylaminohydrolase [Candidatus Aminicenantes bacterium]
MFKFKNAIVRRPGRSLVGGITSANLGKPDYELALQQHGKYIDALKRCGVEVTILEADERYPDSVFVEDTAVLTEKCAVITYPGAASRQGEEVSIKEALTKFYTTIECIEAPGTLDGGDVMMVGEHFYVGLSERTNEEGARQFAEILDKYGYTVSNVFMEKFLHLKSGLAYLENNNLLVAGEFINHPEFEKFNRIIIDESESYAGNCIWVNDVVLVPLRYPKTKIAIEQAGYKVIEVDVSEFRKLDGGLSCLSLRF